MERWRWVLLSYKYEDMNCLAINAESLLKLTTLLVLHLLFVALVALRA